MSITAKHDSGFPEAINAQTRSGVRRSDFNHLSIEHASALCTESDVHFRSWLRFTQLELATSSLQSTTLMSIRLSVIRGEVKSHARAQLYATY